MITHFYIVTVQKVPLIFLPLTQWDHCATVQVTTKKVSIMTQTCANQLGGNVKDYKALIWQASLLDLAFAAYTIKLDFPTPSNWYSTVLLLTLPMSSLLS